MKKNLIILILLSMSIFATAQTPEILTGKINISKISDNKEYSWYKLNYDNYKPDSIITNELKKHFRGVSVIVFGGTWCEDTQELLPKFYKVMNNACIPVKALSLYMMNRTKALPDGLEKTHKVTRIPTFIFFRKGKEIGRIVETVDNPVEAAILDIIKKN